MKRVWLLRHAKSSWDDPGLADHDRPLARRGHRAAERIARWAAGNGVRPDLVLCSTARRARATLDLTIDALGCPEIEFEDGLYHASADELLARLRTLASGRTDVLLIGHNPGLYDLVALLAPPGPETFPTGALAELRLAIDAWSDVSPGCARLEELVIPRSLPR